MKKVFFLVLTNVALISCSTLHNNSPMTIFIVKNTSDKPIHFEAGVLKHSQIIGPQIIYNSFTVNPNDSVIARQTYFIRTNFTLLDIEIIRSCLICIDPFSLPVRV